MGRFFWVAIVAGYTFGTTSASADYLVMGRVSCETIATEDANETYREFNKWWLLGYFTARNFAADANGDLKTSVGKDITEDALYAMGLDFCRRFPDQHWHDAALHVYDLLD